MRKVHEIDGVGIYESDLEFDGFGINPLEIEKLSRPTLRKIKQWCAEFYRTYSSAEIFSRLNYRFNEQFMAPEDLALIAEEFAGQHIGERATEEMKRLIRKYI